MVNLKLWRWGGGGAGLPQWLETPHLLGAQVGCGAPCPPAGNSASQLRLRAGATAGSSPSASKEREGPWGRGRAPGSLLCTLVCACVVPRLPLTVRKTILRQTIAAEVEVTRGLAGSTPCLTGAMAGEAARPLPKAPTLGSARGPARTSVPASHLLVATHPHGQSHGPRPPTPPSGRSSEKPFLLFVWKPAQILRRPLPTLLGSRSRGQLRAASLPTWPEPPTPAGPSKARADPLAG